MQVDEYSAAPRNRARGVGHKTLILTLTLVPTLYIGTPQVSSLSDTGIAEIAGIRFCVSYGTHAVWDTYCLLH